MFIKLKRIKVSQMVAVPVGLDYDQKHTEYENGIVLKIGPSTKHPGKTLAEIKYWHHLTGKILTKTYYTDQLRKANYYHRANEEQECRQALGVI